MEILFFPIVVLAAAPGLAFVPALLMGTWVLRRWPGFGGLRRVLTGTALGFWVLYAVYETAMYFWMRSVIAPIRVDLLLLAPFLYLSAGAIVVSCVVPVTDPRSRGRRISRR